MTEDSKMKTSHQIHQVAALLDSQGKSECQITVIGSREYLRPCFPPLVRGGPLMCGKHEIVLLERAKPQELVSQSLFDDVPENVDVSVHNGHQEGENDEAPISEGSEGLDDKAGTAAC